jgi:DNA polymerase-3 subunit beta
MPEGKQVQQKSKLLTFALPLEAIRRELGFVQTVVEKKTSIPVLSNILIESVGENTVRFTGTDLDITIRCEAEAEIETGGAMCVRAQKLFDIVRLLEDGSVHFAKDENDWVRVTSGNSRFRLAGVGADQFPETPQFRNAPLKLPAEIFHYFINNTAFAITSEQSRFTLSGAKFIIDGLTALMVATDGHRLAYAEKALESPLDGGMNCLIPKKALLELVKISDADSGEVAFGEDPNHVFFEVGGRRVIARKLTGSFPNYEMVIPKDNDKQVSFDAEVLRRSLSRVALMTDEFSRAIKLTVRQGEIEISASNSEEGEASEKVAADHDGDEETVIGAHSRYVDEVLKLPVMRGESKQASIHFTDSTRQIVFKSENDALFQYILMPLRV